MDGRRSMQTGHSGYQEADIPLRIPGILKGIRNTGRARTETLPVMIGNYPIPVVHALISINKVRRNWKSLFAVTPNRHWITWFMSLTISI